MAESPKRISKLLGPDDAVFASETGRPLDDRNILNRRIILVAEALGIKLTGWHDLRRTFSTMSDELGVTLDERQALMGHADARMTMHYTKTPTKQAVQAIERMSKLITGTEGKPN